MEVRRPSIAHLSTDAEIRKKEKQRNYENNKSLKVFQNTEPNAWRQVITTVTQQFAAPSECI